MNTGYQRLKEVSDDLFDAFHYPEVKQLLWNWLKIAMSSEMMEPREKDELFALYESLCHIIDALHPAS